MSIDRGTSASSIASTQSEAVANRLSVSSNPLSNVTIGLGLPVRDLVGKRMLDVAAGLSDFTCRANDEGAEAFAVDILYGNPKVLRAKGKEFTDDQEKTIGRKSIKAQAGQLHPDLQALYDELTGSTASRCLDDMEANPGRYVAADAMNLPFANGSFQTVVSHSFLTSLEGLYPEFVTEVILEMLRVTERGGMLRIGPNETMLGGGVIGRKTEQDLKAAFEKAKALKLADKFSRYSIGDGMLWYNISRSRKR